MLAAAALFICTGTEGGCGGSLDPQIERPTPGQECPNSVPQFSDDCALDEDVVCNYVEMSCCDAEGNLDYTAYTTFAHCNDGQWVVAQQRIGCAYGYWPNDCYDPMSFD